MLRNTYASISVYKFDFGFNLMIPQKFEKLYQTMKSVLFSTVCKLLDQNIEEATLAVLNSISVTR